MNTSKKNFPVQLADSAENQVKEEYKIAAVGIQWRERHSIPITPDSGGLGWKSMHVAGRRWFPSESEIVPSERNTIFSLYLDNKMVLDRKIGGSRWVQRNLERGSVQLVPSKEQIAMRLHTSGDSIQINLKDAYIWEVASDMVKGDPTHLELRPLFGEMDPALTHLARVAQSALTLPALVSIPHADTVAAALVAHLIQYHSNKTVGTLPLSDAALGRQQLEAVRCYIHSHLHRGISLAELAPIAGLSIAQLIRQFKQATGVPPHQYILQARVEKARLLLERNRDTIANIAVDCGFDSQSSLTRVFQRFLGTTPKVYRIAYGRRALL
jgi:AraC family transcriptional regulator